MANDFSESRRRVLMGLISLMGVGSLSGVLGQTSPGRPIVSGRSYTSGQGAGSPPSEVAAARLPSQSTAMPSESYRPRIIVVDPGHGGHHRGGQGRVDRRQIDEANMTMPIALALEKLLQRDPMFQPRLTRRDDSYVGLRERTRRAEQFNGNLFVSIHYNAAPNAASARTARGLEFYTWSPRNADTVASRYLRALNNEEGPYSDISRSNDAARPVLDKMLQDALEGQSLQSVKVARAFEETFMRDPYFRRHYRGRKTERFKVLENYNMPSVLIEVAFISHPEEARMATDPSFQQRVAGHIYEGIVRYYEDSDPVFRVLRRSRSSSAR